MTDELETCQGCGSLMFDHAVHFPHRDDCGGIEDDTCMCYLPSCDECCTDPGCQP